MNGDGASYEVVGRINGVFGIKGWVKISSFTEPEENLFTYSPWRVKKPDGWKDVQLDQVQRHKGGWIAQIDGVSDRNAAEAYKLAEIFVDRGQFAELEDDEFYWHELIGMNVFIDDEQRSHIGVVHEMLETGANDVIVVKPVSKSVDDRERLIPYDPDTYVKEINREERYILVDWNIED